MAAPTRRELLEAVMEKLGTREPYQVAKRLRLGNGNDGYQKARRWILEDKPLRYEDAAVMLEYLGWLRTERPAIDVVEEFVRRLDAGERISARERERVAKMADRLERDVRALAVRIREDARAAHKT